MRDHGGDLARARERYGGARGEWLDLSTGINRRPYPAAAPSADALQRLPDADAVLACEAAARRAYGVPDGADVVAVAGAQAAIQALPALLDPGRAAIVSPTYNEHAAAFAAAGWRVDAVASPERAGEADAFVLVNPNNPDGRAWSRDAVAAFVRPRRALIVDESFCDVAPERSCAPLTDADGVIVLKSLGKFFGLAGLRLGFALCAPSLAARLRAALGPWSVSGPALEIGAAALADGDWARAARERLGEDGRRLDALAAEAGWRAVGGCGLFQTYDVGDAAAVQDALAARARIWTRRFPYSDGWLRLGAPGSEAEWERLERAVRGL